MAATFQQGPLAHEITAFNLLLEAAAGGVVEALRRAGLRSVLFKGAATERWLYETDPREYGDVDLLVNPADFEDCERVLEGLGFERSPIERLFARGRPSHASTWMRGQVTIDLHRTLVGVGVGAEAAWSTLSASTERWTVGRSEVEVLPPAARCLTLALHAAQHGPGFGRTKDDLDRAIRRVPMTTWLEAASLARSLEADASMAAGLLSISGGARLYEALGLRLVHAVPREGSTSFHAAQGLVWLLAKRGARAKARYAWMKLFPPSPVMRNRIPWARSGRLALAAAYAARLVRALASAPRALWALAQLRRDRG
jgi:putative nucleotidyltransferase-like protein